MEKEVMSLEIIEKKERGKRAWVKPAATIFLIVMLLLTFFSNTIMNISLAEVSTQQVSSGAITAKVRGTGTVSSAKNYDVVLGEPRTVEDVKIAVGDTVNAGDILFVLDQYENPDIKEAQELLAELNHAYQEAVLSADPSTYDAESTAVSRAEQALADANNERSAFGTSTMTVSQATEALRIANVEAAEITAQKTSLENQLALMEEDDSERAALVSQILQVTSNLEVAEATVRTAQNTLNNETNIAAADDAVKTAEQALEDAKLALAKVLETKKQQSAVNDLNLTAQQEKIADQEEKIAKLQENAVDRELAAKYSGVVTAVNITAGSVTTPDSPIVQIAVSEEGYSAEMTITKKQAKVIKVGDTAEVTSSDWSIAINATVETIRNSASDEDVGSTDKTIVFKLEGEDLTIGEALNFTLSQKSTNYDLLVPNSAIKTDNNGSFILIIKRKDTPLGTRYVATRVDITVIERDETYTAVSGNLSHNDSVITTASKIVEPGDYVRLAENN